jgi:hypothetical protein
MVERRALLVVTAVVTLLGAVATYALHEIPFGTLFNLSVAVTLGGAVLSLTLMTLRSLASGDRWGRVAAAVLLTTSVTLIVLSAIAVTDLRVLHFRSLPPSPTTEQWRDDLAYLADQMILRHPNLFAAVSREEFADAVGRLDARMGTLTESEILAGLFEVTALPRDGHTGPVLSSPHLRLHLFPLQTYWFGDSLVIVGTGREHRGAIGSRIVAIEGVEVVEIRERMRRYVAADNPYSALDRLPRAMMTAELLEAEGIVPAGGRAVFTLEDRAGERHDLAVRAVSHLAWHYWSRTRTVPNTSAPVIPNRRKDYYWFTFLEDSRTLYFGFNQVSQQPGRESINAFTTRMVEFAEAHDAERLVVDLRANHGGNGRRVPALVERIGRATSAAAHGRLFVLMGRTTYSAAVLYASMLANNTRAVFVGEPTGQGPRFYSVASVVELPHSRLEFEISSMVRCSPSLVRAIVRIWQGPNRYRPA